MTEKEDKILKDHIKDDFATTEVNTNIEEKIMEKISSSKSLYDLPLVSKSVRRFFMSLAIILPVIAIIISITASPTETEIVGNVEHKVREFISGPFITVVGVVLIYISIDVLFRYRKRFKKV